MGQPAWRLTAPAVALAALVWSASAGAQAPGPLSGEVEAAFQRMLANPSDLDATFRYAELSAQRGNLEGAISALERMLLFNPNLPRVKLELGRLYGRLGSFDIARSYLERALEAKDMPPELRGQVETALETIDKQNSRHKISGGVTVGLRYQSNANSGPGSASVLVLGIPFELDRRFTNQHDWNAFTATQLQHSYVLDEATGHSWDTDLTLFGTRQFEQHQVDLGLGEISSGPRLHFGGDQGPGSGTIRPYVIASAVELNRRPYQTGWGGGVSVAVQALNSVGVTLAYELRDRSHHNYATYPFLTDRNGLEHSARAGVRWGFAENQTITAEFGVRFLQARTGIETNHEVEGALHYTLGFDSPLPSLLPRAWLLDAQAGVSRTEWGEIDTLVDPDTLRRDTRWTLSAGLTIPLDTNFAVQTQLFRIDNRSSIRNYTYENSGGLLALSWRF